VFGGDVRQLRRERLAGALIPLTLRSLGADPATASSIFLTTATDVASMGLFLTLATLLVR
jgi:magnesium transporter